MNIFSTIWEEECPGSRYQDVLKLFPWLLSKPYRNLTEETNDDGDDLSDIANPTDTEAYETEAVGLGEEESSGSLNRLPLSPLADVESDLLNEAELPLLPRYPTNSIATSRGIIRTRQPEQLDAAVPVTEEAVRPTTRQRGT
jgi:hypothetical protein